MFIKYIIFGLVVKFVFFEENININRNIFWFIMWFFLEGSKNVFCFVILRVNNSSGVMVDW